MKKLVLVLAAAFGVAAGAPSAQALPVDITYGLSGVLAVPAVGIPALGPLGSGSLTIRYSAASANSGLASVPLPPGALVGLSSGPVHLQLLTFMQVIGFAFAGDVFTGMVSAMAGPSAPGLLAAGGTLMIGPVSGGFAGTIHCAGATCAGVGLPVSVMVPIGGPFVAPLAALLGPPPSIALAFPLAPFPVGTFAGFVITAMLSATEVSRHVTPEPTSAALLGLGLLGLASIGGWRARRGRRA